MGCGGTIDTGWVPVWPVGDGTSTNYFPLTGWMSTALLSKANVAIDMLADSGDCEIFAYVQTTDDQITLDTEDEIPPMTNTEAPAYSEGPVPTTAVVDKLFLRFGIGVVNQENSANESCLGRLLIDPTF
jgi:hypothetical protein